MLLTHVGRALTRAIKDRTGAEPTFEMTVSMGDDLERFDSPADFRDYVTDEGLKKFSCATISVADPGDAVRAVLHISRKQHPAHDWLKRAVLLEVVAPPPLDADVDDIRDQIAVSVKRGIGRGEEFELEKGVKRFDDSVCPVAVWGSTAETAMLHWRQKSRRLRLVVALVLCLFLVGFVAGYEPWDSDDLEASVATLLAMGLGGMVGMLPYATAAWLRPAFELGDRTRATRVRRFLTGAIGAVAGVVAVASALGVLSP